MKREVVTLHIVLLARAVNQCKSIPCSSDSSALAAGIRLIALVV